MGERDDLCLWSFTRVHERGCVDFDCLPSLYLQSLRLQVAGPSWIHPSPVHNTSVESDVSWVPCCRISHGVPPPPKMRERATPQATVAAPRRTTVLRAR